MNNRPSFKSAVVHFSHAEIQAQLQNLLISTSATIDSIDSENLDKVARIVTNIHVSKQQDAFLNHLNRFIKKKESEIEAVCRGHYQDFLSSVDQLLNVRHATISLKTNVLTLNGSIQNSGNALQNSATELLETRKVLRNIMETTEILESYLQLLDLSKKLIIQIDQFKFYSGLRLIDEIQFQNLLLLKPRNNNHSLTTISDFSNYFLSSFLPNQVNKIRDQVVKQLNSWLYEARQQSNLIGKRAIENIQVRERRWKSRKDRFIHRDHPASFALLGNLNTPVEIAVSERHDYNALDPREEDEEHDSAREEKLIDFSALYLAIHIHETLDRKEELKKSFRDDRRAQAHLIISSIPVSLTNSTNTSSRSNTNNDGFNLDSLGHLIETIVGFFLIETHILRTTSFFRDHDDVDDLWDEMSRTVIQIVIQFLTNRDDLDVLLGVRNHLVMFSRTLEACEYNVAEILELLNRLSMDFLKKLKLKCSVETEQFIKEDDHLPMIVNNLDEFEKVIQVSFLPDTGIWSQSELANQGFPAALPFSAAYPLCCIDIRNYVTKHHAHCESIDREVDDSIRKSLDSLLISNVGVHVLDQIQHTRNLSQLAQIVINTVFFLTACDQLERMLLEFRVRGRGRKLALESKTIFSRILKTVETKMIQEIEAKIQDFFELSQYDWRRKSKIELIHGKDLNESETSVYLKECLDFIENLIQNVLILTPMEFNQNVFFGAWNFIGQRLKSILIDREPAAISDGGLSVLSNDIQFASQRLLQSPFATSESKSQLFRQVLLLFEGLVQTVKLLSSHDVATYLDLDYREKKYNLVDFEKLPLMLTKLLTCMNSVGSNVDPLRKSSVEEVIKAISPA